MEPISLLSRTSMRLANKLIGFIIVSTVFSHPTRMDVFGIPEQWLDWGLEEQDEFAAKNSSLFIELVEDLDGSGSKIAFIYRDTAEKLGLEMPSNEANEVEIDEWIEQIKEGYPQELLEGAVDYIRDYLLHRLVERKEKLRTLEAKYPNRTSGNLIGHYKEHELMLRGQKHFWPEGMSAAARSKASDEIKKQVAQAHIDSLFEAV